MLAEGSDALVAPERLADTGLYANGRIGAIDPRNRPFSPQYPLWSDGATKSRWVYLPPGSAIDTTDPSAWTFPVGARFWKEFRFDGRPVETRFIWRASEDRWVLASYEWNAEGTDARLAPARGVLTSVEVVPGRKHAIPSVTDCRACHETRRVEILGFNALQLSTDRDPGAAHAETLQPEMVTLATLDADGWLSPARPGLVAHPPRIRTTSPVTRSVLGYLSTNCGICHNPAAGITLLGASLGAGDMLGTDAEALVREMLVRTTAWTGPGHTGGSTRLVDLEAPDESAVLLRMRSRRPSSQMPPLGSVVADADAVALVRAWIDQQSAH